ncbi:hypothetical protein [Halovenus salina]|uniref:PGF-CTERM protein n=1 Tax=Halovenus salina TaxID=1510225 RepID=A0ABD5VWT1_9EURY|nr:hypothetical protein [Halovenus salina]
MKADYIRVVGFSIAALVLCVCATVALAAGASAQETGNETTTDQEITEQLGDLVVHSYAYEDTDDGPGRFTIDMTWTGRAPEQVTLTEMLELDSGGSTEISFQQQRLVPDQRTEITMNAEVRSGGTAAILVSTSESVERGEAVVLQDGDPTERPSIKFRNVVVAIGLSSALTGAGAFIVVLRRKNDENRTKERIA